MDIEKYIKSRKIQITEPEYIDQRSKCSGLSLILSGTALASTLLGKLVEGYSNQYCYYFPGYNGSNVIDCISINNTFNSLQSDCYSIQLRHIPGLMFLEKVFSRYPTIESIPIALDQGSIVSEVEDDLRGTVLWMFCDFREYNLEFRSNRILKHRVKIVDIKLKVDNYSSVTSLAPETVDFVDIDTGRKVSGKFAYYCSRFFVTEEDLLGYVSGVKERVRERVNNEIASIERQLKSLLEKRRNLYDKQDNLEDTINNILPK